MPSQESQELTVARKGGKEQKEGDVRSGKCEVLDAMSTEYGMVISLNFSQQSRRTKTMQRRTKKSRLSRITRRFRSTEIAKPRGNVSQAQHVERSYFRVVVRGRESERSFDPVIQ